MIIPEKYTKEILSHLFILLNIAMVFAVAYFNRTYVFNNWTDSILFSPVVLLISTLSIISTMYFVTEFKKIDIYGSKQ